MFNFIVAPKSASKFDDDVKAEAVLRVHLSSLFASIDTDGINYDSLRALRERWLANLLERSVIRTLLSRWLRIPQHSYVELLASFIDSLLEADFFQSRRETPGWMLRLEPWSFQTDSALEHWFDLTGFVRKAKYRRWSPTDIRRIEESFRKKDGLLRSATVGRAACTLWSTGRLTVADFEPSGVDSLRDALGLYNCRAGEFVFMVKLGSNFDSLGVTKAPTAFDAGGYPRFRPWPSLGGTRDSEAGRTYDLDTLRRRTTGVNHGRFEMVLGPIPLGTCADLKGLEYISDNTDSSVESYLNYGLEISPESSAASLIVKLQAI